MQDSILYGAAVVAPYLDNIAGDAINNDISQAADAIAGVPVSDDSLQSVLNIALVLILKYVPMLIQAIREGKRKRKERRNEGK